MQYRADDYGLAAALSRVALGNKSFRQCFTCSQRQRMLKLREHFMQLASDAMGEEEARREQHQKVIERRTARRMPSVSREEADEWHTFLTPRRPRR